MKIYIYNTATREKGAKVSHTNLAHYLAGDLVIQQGQKKGENLLGVFELEATCLSLSLFLF